MVKSYEKAITSNCYRTLEYLTQQNFIDDFYLAGGTALALQIGHRISTDLDWFSTSRRLLINEREEINLALHKSGNYEVISEQDGMLFSRLFEADVSFIYQHHPLLESSVEFHGIKLASVKDIGLKKLAAINSGGTRRDFVDLFCLREIVTLEKLLEFAAVKYADRSSFLAIAAPALAYFEDAEQQPIPKMLKSTRWKNVRNYREPEARRLTRRLSGLE